MANENNAGIRAVILDSGISMKEMQNVKIIRIKSDKYNLLMMKDYWPIIGEMHGSVAIEGENSIHYDNITAFYSMIHNVFHLIIKEKNIPSVSEKEPAKKETKKW